MRAKSCLLFVASLLLILISQAASSSITPTISNQPTSSIQSNNAVESFEDCPICFEQLEKQYPSYFECTHSIFHTKCIFRKDAHSPLVKKCPLCRANLRPEMKIESSQNNTYPLLSETEHFRALEFLLEGKYLLFYYRIRDRTLRDQHINMYTKHLINGYGYALSLLDNFHVNDWGLYMKGLFMQGLTRGFTLLQLKKLIRIGSLSDAHITYALF